jgi:hypothetical protein
MHFIFRTQEHHRDNFSCAHADGKGEACSVRGHNWYVLGPGSRVGGIPYQPVFGTPEVVPTVSEDDYKRTLAALPPRSEEPKAAEPAPAIPITKSGPPRIDSARKYLEKVPGTVAGHGLARGQCFYLACQLAHAFALDFATALDLFAAWGARDSNRRASGAYYPWLLDTSGILSYYLSRAAADARARCEGPGAHHDPRGGVTYAAPAPTRAG